MNPVVDKMDFEVEGKIKVTQMQVSRKVYITCTNIEQTLSKIILETAVESKEEFSAKQILPNQAEVLKLDQRSSLFFNWMMKRYMEGVGFQRMKNAYLQMQWVNDALDSQFGDLREVAKKLSIVQNNPPLFEDFLKAAAFPCIKNMIIELDQLQPLAIDSIINGTFYS